MLARGRGAILKKGGASTGNHAEQSSSGSQPKTEKILQEVASHEKGDTHDEVIEDENQEDEADIEMGFGEESTQEGALKIGLNKQQLSESGGRTENEKGKSAGSENVRKENDKEDSKVDYKPDDEATDTLESKVCIPPVYLGPAFDKSFFEYSVRISPAVIQDIMRPELRLPSFARSLRAISEEKNSFRAVEILTISAKMIELMKNLLYNTYSSSLITVELEKRHPASFIESESRRTKNNAKKLQPTDYKFVMNKVTIQQNNAYIGVALKNAKARNVFGSVQQRSLFLNNLPANIDESFLKILFPLSMKIILLKVTRDARSAVLHLRDKEMVLSHLIGFTKVIIDGREIQMRSTHLSQKDALKRYFRSSAGQNDVRKIAAAKILNKETKETSSVSKLQIENLKPKEQNEAQMTYFVTKQKGKMAREQNTSIQQGHWQQKGEMVRGQNTNIQRDHWRQKGKIVRGQNANTPQGQERRQPPNLKAVRGRARRMYIKSEEQVERRIHEMHHERARQAHQLFEEQYQMARQREMLWEREREMQDNLDWQQRQEMGFQEQQHELNLQQEFERMQMEQMQALENRKIQQREWEEKQRLAQEQECIRRAREEAEYKLKQIEEEHRREQVMKRKRELELEYSKQQERMRKQQEEERMRKRQEGERMRKLQEEEQMRKRQEGERMRMRQEEEQMRKLQEEEQMRKLQEEEQMRKLQEEEQMRKLQEEEQMRKLQEEERMRKLQEEERMRKRQKGERKRPGDISDQPAHKRGRWNSPGHRRGNVVDYRTAAGRKGKIPPDDFFSGDGRDYHDSHQSQYNRDMEMPESSHQHFRQERVMPGSPEQDYQSLFTEYEKELNQRERYQQSMDFLRHLNHPGNQGHFEQSPFGRASQRDDEIMDTDFRYQPGFHERSPSFTKRDAGRLEQRRAGDAQNTQLQQSFNVDYKHGSDRSQSSGSYRRDYY